MKRFFITKSTYFLNNVYFFSPNCTTIFLSSKIGSIFLLELSDTLWLSIFFIII